jgi:hypothetical protein
MADDLGAIMGVNAQDTADWVSFKKAASTA